MASGIFGTNHWDNGRKKNQSLAERSFTPCPLQSLEQDTLQNFQFSAHLVPRCFQSADAASSGWLRTGMALHATSQSQAGMDGRASPVWRPSAGAGCAGSPRGGCPGAAGSSSCSARAPRRCQGLARPSCRASTRQHLWRGRNPPTPATAAGHRAWHSRACPAPPAVLRTRKPQHTPKRAALSSALGSKRLS